MPGRAVPGRGSRESRARGYVRATAFLALTGGLIPVYLALAPFVPHVRRPMRRLWSRGTCAILGIRLRRAGEPFRACPALHVANHSSYLDVVCLGTLLDSTFIAKSEVEGWPFFGYIARLVGTMFVRRHWRQALVQREALAARLREGESFLLFGEGTSTNGLDVRPFKTSLLSVAEPWVTDRPVAVQPVTVVYLRLRDGTPIDATNNGLYSWWGSADLGPHLWKVLKQPGVLVEVHFGPPVLSWAVTSRKVLARELRAEVRQRLLGRRGLPVPEDDPWPAGGALAGLAPAGGAPAAALG